MTRRRLRLSAVWLLFGACSLFRPDRDELSGGAPNAADGGGVAGDVAGAMFESGAGGVIDEVGTAGSREGGGPGQGMVCDGSAPCGEGGTAGGEGGTNAESGALGTGEGGAGGELEIPGNGLVLWLRSDWGVSASNGVVSEWQDASGMKLDGKPPAPALGPTLPQFGIGGLPMVTFSVGQSLRLPDVDVNWSEGATFFTVARSDTLGCGVVLSLADGFGAPIAFSFASSASVQWRIGDAVMASPPGVFGEGHTILASAVQTPGENLASLFVNGELLHQSDMPPPAEVNRSQNHIGRDDSTECGLFGAIGEIILYRRRLEGDELKNVASYLQLKWSIYIPPT